jgi:hypothetical protein
MLAYLRRHHITGNSTASGNLGDIRIVAVALG